MVSRVVDINEYVWVTVYRTGYEIYFDNNDDYYGQVWIKKYGGKYYVDVIVNKRIASRATESMKLNIIRQFICEFYGKEAEHRYKVLEKQLKRVIGND